MKDYKNVYLNGIDPKYITDKNKDGEPITVGKKDDPKPGIKVFLPSIGSFYTFQPKTKDGEYVNGYDDRFNEGKKTVSLNPEFSYTIHNKEKDGTMVTKALTGQEIADQWKAYLDKGKDKTAEAPEVDADEPEM